MRENFEIEKELKFNTNLAEILSISLEEKHEIKEGKLLGNFIISGEYKIHEVSLNKERFNFKLPFEYEIKNDIDESTLSVDISNFIYDSDKETLYVTIDYEVLGDRKDILLFDDEENLEEFLKSREVEIIMDDMSKEVDEAILKTDEVVKENDSVLKAEEAFEDLENNVSTQIEEGLVLDDNEIDLDKDVVINANDNAIEDENKDGNLEENSRNIEEAKNELMKNVKVNDDNFITYQIHIVKESDTIESILTKYSMNLDELKEYNDFNMLSLGDKLIIPVINEK